MNRQLASGSRWEEPAAPVTRLGDPKIPATSSQPRNGLPRANHRDCVEESSRELGHLSRHHHETPKSPVATARLQSRLSEAIDEPTPRSGPEGPSSVCQLGPDLVGAVGLSWNLRRSRGTAIDLSTRLRLLGCPSAGVWNVRMVPRNRQGVPRPSPGPPQLIRDQPTCLRLLGVVRQVVART